MKVFPHILMTMLFLMTGLLFFCSQAVGESSDQVFAGHMEDIPEAIKRQMTGVSWLERLPNGQKCPVGLDQLRYLTLSHWGFDGKVHEGYLVVAATQAANVLKIFEELFKIKFPIEKLTIASDPTVPKWQNAETDRYPAGYYNDFKSMRANNSLAFACRYDGDSPDELSSHSWGLAIDLNPVFNPYMSMSSKELGNIYLIRPENFRYWNRTSGTAGLISPGEEVVRIFRKYGWIWGGYWPGRGDDYPDYMHFQVQRHCDAPHYSPDDSCKWMCPGQSASCVKRPNNSGLQGVCSCNADIVCCSNAALPVCSHPDDPHIGVHSGHCIRGGN